VKRVAARAAFGVALAALAALGPAARAATEAPSAVATPAAAPVAGKSKEPKAPKAGATAKDKGKAASGSSRRPALPVERLEALRSALEGPEDAWALEAAAALGSSAAPNAGEPLLETLAIGAPAVRTEAALDALAKLGNAGALGGLGDRPLEILELYAGHRVPDLRRRAVKALGTLREARFAPAVVPILLARLGDAAADVRATAGEALADRHEVKAAARLFALVKRGDAAGAEPLAAVATPDMVPQIAELAGNVDDGVLATTLGEYVKRDDVPDKLRVDVLRTIGGLAGAAATTALVEYVASIPAKDNRPSKREAQKLLDQRGTK
jgi:HEAT repeat protein